MSKKIIEFNSIDKITDNDYLVKVDKDNNATKIKLTDFLIKIQNNLFVNNNSQFKKETITDYIDNADPYLTKSYTADQNCILIYYFEYDNLYKKGKPNNDNDIWLQFLYKNELKQEVRLIPAENLSNGDGTGIQAHIRGILFLQKNMTIRFRARYKFIFYKNHSLNYLIIT